MIFLSKTTADSNAAGQLKIRQYQMSPEYDVAARISRDKTLDGSTVVSHFGNCELDRSPVIECRLSLADQAILKSYKANATVLRISFHDGAFIGYVNRLKISRDGKTKIYLYFTEELTS